MIISFSFLEKALDRDNFMSPVEAQSFGVVDHVLAHTPVGFMGNEDKNESDKESL